MAKGKILIVEDNRNSAELVKDYLESWDYSVTIVYQGYEGLEYAQKENYDFILLDIMLPGLSGYEIAREVRKINRVIPPYIIVVSALGSVEDRINTYNAGADQYLEKPIDFGELKAILSNVTGKRQFFDKLEDADLVLTKFGEALKIFSKIETVRNVTENQFVVEVLKDAALSVPAKRLVALVSLHFAQIKSLWKKKERYANMQTLFEGYSCTKDYFAILKFVMTEKLVFKGDKQIGDKDAENKIIARWCYGLNMFLDYFEECDGDYGYAFDKFLCQVKRTILPDEFIDTLQEKIEGIELRKTLLQ